MLSAAQSDGHSSAAAINSDKSENPPAYKGSGADDIQGPAERVPEHPTSEGVKNESSVLTESYSGGAKPATQKLGHVESLHGKSTGTTASQVSTIQELGAAADCDQTKQQNQQVDRQQCLNGEVIRKAKRAEAAHLQRASKASGSNDPSESSQASQSMRGRDDPTTQSNDQITKKVEGGIEVRLFVSTRRILQDIAFRLSSQSSSVLLSHQYCMHNRFDHIFM